MITVRRSADRGHADHGWLDTRFSFSFAHYHDPEHMGFRTLRVINDDIIQPGQGFGTHGHRDMEIVTYVLEGALEHRDSTGTGSVLRPGDVQRMTAGRGVRHSEFNHSESDPLRLLQIWIFPEEKGLEPGYEEVNVPEKEKRDRLRRIVARDAGEGELKIHQDATIHAAVLSAGETISHDLAPGRGAWIQVATGKITVDGVELRHGDGASIEEVEEIEIRGVEESELLLFDLA